jgi:SAM-dependent methyltransferase
MSDDITTEPHGRRTLADPQRLYGHWYYETSCGLPYHHNDHWQSFFGAVADNMVRQLEPKRVLDAGCAKGFLVAALRERGVEAFGFDLSELAITEAPAAARPHLRVGSLTEPIEPIEGPFDLVTCIEVIEHLDPVDAPTAVANLCSASDRVLLSSTPADLHEATHVNVQPPERWSQLFAGHGFFRDFRHDAAYLSPWATLYRREERSVSDVVVDYDRAWAQLRAETLAQRRALLELQAQCEELRSEQDIESQRDIESERIQLRQEILRLRDAIIGKEAELGTMRGRAAEIQAQLRRTEEAAGRLDAVLTSRSWRLAWAFGRPVRALRRGAR